MVMVHGVMKRGMGGPNASLYCNDYSFNCPALVVSIGCSTTDDRVRGCQKTCAGQPGFPA